MTMARADIANQVLEGVNYIRFPASVNDVKVISEKIPPWASLGAEMHVYDFKSTQSISSDCLQALSGFAEKLKMAGINLISVNMSETIYREVKRLGLEAGFNRIMNFPQDLQKKKALTETELRRLLFRYLAKGAFMAVEVSLNSTVACDENYSAKPNDVPLEQFDMIAVVPVNTDFLQAEFRLCAQYAVLERLAKAMLGNETNIDRDLVESMALELLNMIYGYAKSNLNEKEGFQLPPVIPRLMRKPDFHRIKRSGSSSITIMPMVTPMGSFYVEVDFGKFASPKA